MAKPIDTSGTVVDVEYTGGYFWHQAPSMMNYIAMVNGYTPRPLDRAFAYCELGCGKGVTSVVLAALHPKGHFFACDLNPEHVRGARALTKTGGIANVKFLERDIAKMTAEKLPKFDFITLHGLWSWVSGEVRAQIRAFIKAKLKPKGLVMLSYNAMPGWAHIQPIRRMMHAYADGLSGKSIDKARRAYAYVRFLADNNAGYFVTNPASVEQLNTVASADVRYFIHDYMTPHGDPFYFSEVEQSMREVGLAFAGSLVPAQNYPELSVAKQFQQLMNTAPTRAVLETHRDFVANTRFRVDLYAAQPGIAAGLSAGRPKLDGVQFRLMAPAASLVLAGEVDGVRFEFTPFAQSVRAVHALLEKGPADGDAIERAAGMPGPSASRLIQELVLARHIWPCAQAGAASNCDRLQEALLEMARREGAKQAIRLSPSTGSAEYVAVSTQAAAPPRA
jgi:SAM-dependent methyltransferase